MRLLLGVTTYCRMVYLQEMLETWKQTRNRQHEWVVIIADDGSPSEQIRYVRNQLCGIEHYIIHNHGRGVHHQVNSILYLASQLEFDFGFRADDDIRFKASGWDDAYLKAAQITGYYHLVHHDPYWKRVKTRKMPQSDLSGMLENRANADDLQGAFWTFSKVVLDKVGYIDVELFNLCGFGHRDYTYRCCKAGLNHRVEADGLGAFDQVYDLKDSLEYIELIKNNYVSAPDRDRIWSFWNKDWSQKKAIHFCDGRIFVAYRENDADLELRPVRPSKSMHYSATIPLML